MTLCPFFYMDCSLEELFSKYSLDDNPDSLSIVNFIAEFEQVYGINLFEYDISKLTDINYLSSLIN